MNRKTRIEDRLRDALAPVHLEVSDDSHRHAVPPGSESHFKVLAVSDAFAGQPLLRRHRVVNKLLADELSSGLHALALHTWTPDEWQARGGGAAPESPPCRGGSRNAGTA